MKNLSTLALAAILSITNPGCNYQPIRSQQARQADQVNQVQYTLAERVNQAEKEVFQFVNSFTKRNPGDFAITDEIGPGIIYGEVSENGTAKVLTIIPRREISVYLSEKPGQETYGFTWTPEKIELETQELLIAYSLSKSPITRSCTDKLFSRKISMPATPEQVQQYETLIEKLNALYLISKPANPDIISPRINPSQLVLNITRNHK